MRVIVILLLLTTSALAESTAQRDAPTTKFYDSRGNKTGSATQYGDQIRIYDSRGNSIGVIAPSNKCGGCK